jgi:hypothetical protein
MGVLGRSQRGLGCHKGCHKLALVVPKGILWLSYSSHFDTWKRLNMRPTTRQTKADKRNEKGQLVRKVGGRTGYRVFKFGKDVSPAEIESRVAKIKEAYRVCHGWNDLSNHIAEFARKGISPVPVPDFSLRSILGLQSNGWVGWRRDLVRLLPTIQWGTLEESGIQENMLDSCRRVQQLLMDEAADGLNSIYGGSFKV